MRDVFMDIRTTGWAMAEGHRMCEIALIETVRKVPTGRVLHAFFNPNRSSDEQSFNRHGLSGEFLSTMPEFKGADARAVRDFIGNSRIFSHNKKNDMSVLNNELRRAGIRRLPGETFVDTKDILRDGAISNAKSRAERDELKQSKFFLSDVLKMHDIKLPSRQSAVATAAGLVTVFAKLNNHKSVTPDLMIAMGRDSQISRYNPYQKKGKGKDWGSKDFSKGNAPRGGGPGKSYGQSQARSGGPARNSAPPAYPDDRDYDRGYDQRDYDQRDYGPDDRDYGYGAAGGYDDRDYGPPIGMDDWDRGAPMPDSYYDDRAPPPGYEQYMPDMMQGYAPAAGHAPQYDNDPYAGYEGQRRLSRPEGRMRPPMGYAPEPAHAPQGRMPGAPRSNVPPHHPQQLLAPQRGPAAQYPDQTYGAPQARHAPPQRPMPAAPPAHHMRQPAPPPAQEAPAPRAPRPARMDQGRKEALEGIIDALQSAMQPGLSFTNFMRLIQSKSVRIHPEVSERNTVTGMTLTYRGFATTIKALGLRGAMVAEAGITYDTETDGQAARVLAAAYIRDFKTLPPEAMMLTKEEVAQVDRPWLSAEDEFGAPRHSQKKSASDISTARDLSDAGHDSTYGQSHPAPRPDPDEGSYMAGPD